MNRIVTRHLATSGLTIIFALASSAQGVIHLNSGDSYLFSQPTLTGFQINEGSVFVSFQLGFTNDLFTSGDSLQVDILSTPTSLTPLLSGSVTNPPWSYVYGKGFSWSGVDWNAVTGAVRVTMLTGSVDISDAEATTASFITNQRLYSYTIPEPSSGSLVLFSGALLGGALCLKRPRAALKTFSFLSAPETD